jgi:hypothetical protein
MIISLGAFRLKRVVWPAIEPQEGRFGNPEFRSSWDPLSFPHSIWMEGPPQSTNEKVLKEVMNSLRNRTPRVVDDKTQVLEYPPCTVQRDGHRSTNRLQIREIVVYG